SFIEALASPTTLVITAASSDPSSFGCSHENEWTYFGEAYFEKGLKQAPSFISAFETARTAIARREAAEGKKASDPQISIGSEIGAYLTQQRL
ncbi:MAG TPA: C13 family peptidase, partial [Gammaproteobacteria bacterium]|nr:C13 family peptidase [Gammaproteobacteria bacterium]